MSETTHLNITHLVEGQGAKEITINGAWDLFDAKIAGAVAKSVAGAVDVTLLDTAAEAMNATIEFTGAITASISVIFPTEDRVYILQNSTTGAFTVTVKLAASAGFVLTQGLTVLAYSNGTDIFALATGGLGTVTGPGSSTDNALTRWNGTTGTIIQDSSSILDDNDNLGVGQATFGASAAKVLAIGLGTAPTTNPADAIQMWVADIAGAGTSGLRILSEDGTVPVVIGEHTIFPLVNDAATPTVAFGDGDSGFYESADDQINIAILGAATFELAADVIRGANANGPAVLNEAASATNPTLSPDKTDLNTGIGLAAADSLSLIAGALEGFRVISDTTLINAGIGITAFGTSADKVFGIGLGAAPTTSPANMVQMWSADWNGAGTAALFLRVEEGTEHVFGSNVGIGRTDPTSALSMGDDKLITLDTNAGITASTTQTQGQGALTAQVNEIATVANANDTVTLPAALTGLEVIVINNGANNLQVFPASGDNLGAGVDVSVIIEPNERTVYIAHNTINWDIESSTETLHAEMFDIDNTDAYVVAAATEDHMYHTNGLVAGDLDGWTFDLGGGGTSFPIASIADSPGSPGVQAQITTTGSHLLAAGDIVSLNNLSAGTNTGVFVVTAPVTATTFEIISTNSTTATGTMNQAATLIANTGSAGQYLLTWSASATTATNNETFDFAIHVEEVHISSTNTRRKFGTASDFGSLSGTSIIAIANGDHVSFMVDNQDTAGDITMRDLTIVLVRL